MEATLIGYIVQYGYIALYAMLALGIIGLPIPDETLMTFVGSLTSYGHMSYAKALSVSFLGSMTGMLISYYLGRKIGKPFLYRYGKWVYLTPERLERSERWFQKYGMWTVAFGYFVPGIRHFTCYLAGISGIIFWRYVLYAGVGALIWCAAFITLGHVIGHNWELISHTLHKHLGSSGIIITILIVAIAYAFVLYKSRSAQKS